MQKACSFVHDGQTYYVANSLEGPSREDKSTRGITLWDFQFGAYGDTHVLVWTGKHSANRGIEDALEEAAGALADLGFKGHFVDEDEIAKLMVEAQEEDPDLDEEEAFEAATTDMTYTESGYLTSYEWHVGEHHDGDLYDRAAKKAMRDRRAEGWE